MFARTKTFYVLLGMITLDLAILIGVAQEKGYTEIVELLQKHGAKE
ncbi:MAG: hypothetical protein JSV03_15985 [Planctomycetota bacterium]|nr:MAG: hypothetical protein JSV03_15985 [Planctomycetota bacterium]